MLIKDAYIEGLIPIYYKKFFREDCEFCGEPLHITENLTNYRCVNMKCPKKKGKRASKMLDKMGIKNVGAILMEQYFLQVAPEVPILNILIEDISKYPKSMSYQRRHKVKSEFDKIRSKAYKFKELVRILNLPGLDKTILKLFRGINSYEEYKEIVSGYSCLSNFVSTKLDMDSFVLPEKIANILREYDGDIKYLDKVFPNIVNDLGKVALVVMTGVPDGYSDKEEYLKELSDGFTVDLELTDSKSEAVAIIYSDTSTVKYKESVANYREKLVTSESFKVTVEEWKERQK